MRRTFAPHAWGSLFWLCAGLIGFSACGSPAENVAPGSGESRDLLDSESGVWSYQYADEPSGAPASAAWRETRSLFNPGPSEDRTKNLWLRFAPDESLRPLLAEPGAMLYLGGVDEGFVVSWRSDDGDARVLHRYGLAPDGDLTFPGAGYQMIELPPGLAEGGALELQVRAASGNIGIFGEARAGDGAAHIRRMLVQDAGPAVVAIMAIFLGLVGLGFFLSDVRRSIYGGFGLFAGTIGLYILTRTRIPELLYYAPLFWQYVELMALYLAPGALYFYVGRVIGGRLRLWLYGLAAAHLAYAVLALGAALFGLVPLMGTLPPVQLGILVAIPILLGSALYGLTRESAGEARWVLAGMAAVALATLVDLAAAWGWLPWTASQSHYGALVQILFFGVAILRSYRESRKELERATQQLNDLNRELDQKVADRTREVEQSRTEIEKLSQFNRQINAESDPDFVITQIFAYFYGEFEIEAIILQLVDREKKELYTWKTTAPPNATREMIDYSRELRIPLDERAGLLKRTLERRKPFYLARVDRRAFPEGAEREMVDRLQLQSFFLMPLVIQGEPIAMILFTSYDRRLQLSRDQIDKISRFSDQIAGALYQALLLKQAEDARKSAEESHRRQLAEKLRADNARAEIVALNNFTREISRNTDIDEILEMIFEYVISQFNMEGIVLFMKTETEAELFAYKSVLPGRIDPMTEARIKKTRIPLNAEEGGTLYRIHERRRPLFLRNFRLFAERPARGDELILELEGMQGLLLLPLLVRNEVIAIISFATFEMPMLLERKDLQGIERFCDQIAGAIRTTTLFKQVRQEREKSDRLLLNILPEPVAQELKEKQKVTPRNYESATVLFTDFRNFTGVAESLSADELLSRLDGVFEQFDLICERNKLEKLKTIGDSYMCAGGLPETNRTHAIDACLAALEIVQFIRQTDELMRENLGEGFWDLRVGIHTGPVIAGVIGKNKFAYDVWGDAVNVASRMETNGEAGRVNISRNSYEQVKYFFDCEYRGKMQAKNRGELDMYFVNGIRKELSADGEGRTPNARFRELYQRVADGARIRFRSEA